MSNSKWRNCIEGLVITGLGLFFMISAIKIQNNPVSATLPWLNAMTQAKFLPLILSACILVLGIYMTVMQLNGKMLSAKVTAEEGKRLAVVVPMIAAYLIAIYYFDFTIPTIVFSAAILLYLNWKKRKLWNLAIICVIYVVSALIVLPKLINLRLP